MTLGSLGKGNHSKSSILDHSNWHYAHIYVKNFLCVSNIMIWNAACLDGMLHIALIISYIATYNVAIAS